MKEKILINQKELLKVIMDLIAIESTNPCLVEGGKGEKEISEYIENYLRNLGLEVFTQEVKPERKNVIGVLKGKGEGKALLLNGHMDTVGGEGMDIEPFTPKFENGKVFGRGSIDMKAGLAGMLIAVDSILKNNLEIKGNLILSFVVDEEYESIGTEALVKEFKADSAIVCEPTNLKIGIAHKGFSWIKVEIFGKSAHGSKPEEGVDAIVKAGKFLWEMENFYRVLTSTKRNELLGSPSIHASLIKGGKELSTYPDYCEIKLERRTIPGEIEREIKGEMEEIFKRVTKDDKDFRGKFEIFFSRPPLIISKEEDIVLTLSKVYREITGKDPEYSGLSFWTDGAILSEHGIPSVIFGPEGSGLHSSVEYVDFYSLKIFTEILSGTILKYCNE